METIKVDLHEVKDKYKGEWPSFDYCVDLIKTDVPKNSRVEFWNYKREVSEADWIVEDLEFYVKNALPTKKRGIRGRGMYIEWP